MNTHYSFPNIDQFRGVIRTVKDRCTFSNIGLPKLSFHGTIKLHGMNVSVIVGEDASFYCQSRSNVLTPGDDNAGFAAYVHGNDDVRQFLLRFASLAKASFFSRDYETPFKCLVGIYGEWCGGNIQKGVALNQLPKQFVIFGVRLISLESERSLWLMPWEVESIYDSAAAATNGSTVKCIEKYRTWQLTIDMANPAAAQNELVRLTTEVEELCPFGSAHNVSGVGEGIVWTCVGGQDVGGLRISDLVFKVKGEKHSDTKVTTVAAVDIERLNSIKELAQAVTTEHRLEKAVAFLQETMHCEDVFDIRNMGPFLKWVGTDIVKEETDTIVGNGFEVKEVTKAVNNIAKAWFLEQANNSAGLKAA
jgi:hypothetical protein